MFFRSFMHLCFSVSDCCAFDFHFGKQPRFCAWKKVCQNVSPCCVWADRASVSFWLILTVGKSWPVLGLVQRIPPCDQGWQILRISRDSGVHIHFLHALTPKPQCPVCLPVCGLAAQSRLTQLPAISGCSTPPENRGFKC